MKFVSKSRTVEFRNSDTCVAFEYQLNDPDINGAVIRLSGRYLEQGFAVNEVSKELVYVIKGQGTLSVGGTDCQISEGDMALLMPGEKYFFAGELVMMMPCAPAWTPQQHKLTTAALPLS